MFNNKIHQILFLTIIVNYNIKNDQNLNFNYFNKKKNQTPSSIMYRQIVRASFPESVCYIYDKF